MRALFRTLLSHYGPQGWWPGEGTFEIMAGALLVQQTAWRNVERALQRMRDAEVLDWRALQAIPPARLEVLVRPAGFYRTKSRRLIELARFVDAHRGIDGLRAMETDELRGRLLALPGIGPETADAILLYGFERPVFVVDAYTRRLLSRLEARPKAPEDAQIKRRIKRALPAVRDLNELHALIVAHGKAHCRCVPVCAGCCLRSICETAACQRPAIQPSDSQ